MIPFFLTRLTDPAEYPSLALFLATRHSTHGISLLKAARARAVSSIASSRASSRILEALFGYSSNTPAIYHTSRGTSRAWSRIMETLSGNSSNTPASNDNNTSSKGSGISQNGPRRRVFTPEERLLMDGLPIPPPLETLESDVSTPEDKDSGDAEAEEDTEDCPICREPAPDDELFTLPCNHRMHADCIRIWVEQVKGNKTCPCCRESLKHSCGHAIHAYLIVPGGKIDHEALQRQCRPSCDGVFIEALQLQLQPEPRLLPIELPRHVPQTLERRHPEFRERYDYEQIEEIMQYFSRPGGPPPQVLQPEPGVNEQRPDWLLNHEEWEGAIFMPSEED